MLKPMLYDLSDDKAKVACAARTIHPYLSVRMAHAT